MIFSFEKGGRVSKEYASAGEWKEFGDCPKCSRGIILRREKTMQRVSGYEYKCDTSGCENNTPWFRPHMH